MNRALPKPILLLMLTVVSSAPLQGFAHAEPNLKHAKLSVQAESKVLPDMRPAAKIETVAQMAPLQHVQPRLEADTSNPGNTNGGDTATKTAGTVLATLVLMCAIAVRRHRAGRR